MRDPIRCVLARPHNQDIALGTDPGPVYDPLNRS